MNFLEARMDSRGASVGIPGGVKLPLENGPIPEYAGRNITLGIRPEHLRSTGDDNGSIQLTVNHVEQLGADTMVYGFFGEGEHALTVRLPDIQQFPKQTILPLGVPAEKLHLFDRQSGKRIDI